MRLMTSKAKDDWSREPCLPPAAAAAVQSQSSGAAVSGGAQNPALHHIATTRIVSTQDAPLLAKLEVSEPGDPLEEEADRIADQVMRTPEPGRPMVRVGAGPASLQGSCAQGAGQGEDPPDEETTIQRKATNQASTPDVSGPAMAVTRTGGEPLDAATRAFMEPRFGFDFSRVRIHSDGPAAAAAQSVNAQAYTLGTHVVFDAGRYEPGTSGGRRLLAHELTHYVQQNRTSRQILAPGVQGSEWQGAGVAHSVDGTLLRKPARTGKKGSTDKTINTIHAEPRSAEGLGYLSGEQGTVLVTLNENKLAEGTYTLVQTDQTGTKNFVEYANQDGTRVPFHWETPDKTIQTGKTVRVVIGAGGVDLERQAEAAFAAVPAYIKDQVITPGAPRLTTAEEYFGFADFARTLQERGVTKQQLILFQDRAARKSRTARPVDWANNWMEAVNEVLGPAGELEKHEVAHQKEAQQFAHEFSGLSDEAFEVYAASVSRDGDPVLRAAAETELAAGGSSLKDLEARRQSMLAWFDRILRDQTSAALDDFEGALLLARERLRHQDSLAEMRRAREAASTEELLRLKSRKHAARKARNEAAEKEKDPYTRLVRPEWKKARRALKEKTTEYKNARDAHRAALQAATGLRVTSFATFDEDRVFYKGSAADGQKVLEGYVTTRLREVGRARTVLAKDAKTIYKADIMVAFTKQRVGVQQGDPLDRLIDLKVQECADGGWWPWLLDVLSFALVFVPGGSLIVSGLQLVDTVDNEVLKELLNRVGASQEGASAANIILSGLGLKLDVVDLAKPIATVAENVLEETTTEALERVSRVDDALPAVGTHGSTGPTLVEAPSTQAVASTRPTVDAPSSPGEPHPGPSHEGGRVSRPVHGNNEISPHGVDLRGRNDNPMPERVHDPHLMRGKHGSSGPEQGTSGQGQIPQVSKPTTPLKVPSKDGPTELPIPEGGISIEERLAQGGTAPSWALTNPAECYFDTASRKYHKRATLSEVGVVTPDAQIAFDRVAGVVTDYEDLKKVMAGYGDLFEVDHLVEKRTLVVFEKHATIDPDNWESFVVPINREVASQLPGFSGYVHVDKTRLMNQLIPHGFEKLFTPQQVWDAHVKVLKDLGLSNELVRLEPMFKGLPVEFRTSFPADHFSPPNWPGVKKVGGRNGQPSVP